MREATAELNASVIVISAVAVLATAFFMVVWPMVKQGMKEEARCADAVCDAGYVTSGENEGMAPCYNPQEGGNNVFYCPYRG